MVKISVVTVCYNAKNDIEDTIKSVLENKNRSYIEYIIVDGGSNDGTLDIIYKYQNDIDVIISEPDRGVYDAMNKGIKASSGDWILNMNAGDVLYDLPIEKLEKALSLPLCALVGAVKTENGICYPKLDMTFKIHNTLPHQALFYRRANNLFYNITYKIVGDYDMNARLYKSDQNIILVNDIIAFHSLKGLSSNKASAKESYAVIKDHFSLLWVALSFIYRKLQRFL